jgi:hypothetical protein
LLLLPLKKNQNMKNKVLYILLAILLIAALYFYFTNTKSTLKEEYSDFAIEDTSLVTKIVIADQQGNYSVLTRENKYKWIVNGKYEARKDAMDVLLKTLKRIDIQSPVPKSSLESTIKFIAANNKRVEIYTNNNDKPEKVYYVGHNTKNNLGTYMLLEKDGKKSSVPFVTHIPGFDGFLNTRFISDPKMWHSVKVFRYQPNDLAEITVEFPDSAHLSYKIVHPDTNVYKLTDLQENALPANTQKIQDYLTRFTFINFEQVDVDGSPEYQDSIMHTKPFFILQVKDRNGKLTHIKAFRMPNYKHVINNQTGAEFPYDMDRFYGLINDSLFTVMQYPTFDPITPERKFFQE